jgi:hypothetical protein
MPVDTFTYAQAETILARLHDVNSEHQIGAFRARLKHLKRLGIPLRSHPGRGAKIGYTREHLYQWSFCLECAQFGFDPTWTVQWLRAQWSKVIYPVFLIAERHLHPAGEGDDLLLSIDPRMMTYAWGIDRAGKRVFMNPFWDRFPATRLPEGININQMGAHFRRKCLLNVSAVIRMINEYAREITEGA